MAKNLYVGNLPYQTTADDLREAFSKFGEVTRAQVVSRPGNRSVVRLWLCGNGGRCRAGRQRNEWGLFSRPNPHRQRSSSA